MARLLLYFLLTTLLFCTSCNNPAKQDDVSIINEKRIVDTFKKALNTVSLDHFYITLDSVTFAQLKSSDFINSQYANLDQGIPDFTPINTASTSAYLRGKRQYIEILGPQNAFNEPVGKSGIGFALSEKKGFSLANAPELHETGTKFLKAADTVSFNINNTAAVWYKAFYTYGMATNLSTWYAYYNPEFLGHLHDEEISEYTSEAFLKTAYHPKKMFNEITGIEMHCNLADHFRIARELQLLGCTLAGKKNNDLLYVVDGIKLSIRLDETLDKSKITTIAATLNAPDHRTITFKNLTIKNTGYQTVWSLN